MVTHKNEANGVLAGNGETKDSFVFGQTSQGMEIHATLLRLTRYLAVCEIYNPAFVLRTSEVLKDFKVVFRDRSVYSGRAVVRSVVNAGLMTVCEVTLDEGSWTDVAFTPEMLTNGRLREEFKGFMDEWQKLYRVMPEFKVVMADIQTYLSDLRLWLEQIEMEIRSSPSADRMQLERDVVDELAAPVVRSMDAFVERFEAIAGGIEPECQAVHRSYLRRQLHPLVLSSPFAYRTFHKPLGYAGDYEMVNMMLRPPYEGSTLFAKIVNAWLLSQAPALGHRNRVSYLTRKLLEETARGKAQGRITRIFNVGCGPAAEVHRFFRDCDSAALSQLTLLDFNEETLQHLRRTLDETKKRHECGTPVQLVRKSIHQLLKESGKSIVRPQKEQYDFVYCAGLFDYLTDQVCQRLMNIFYDMVAPGGLLLATNVSDDMNGSHPFRYSMEYILDWHLIYRNGRELAALAPEKAPLDSVATIAENASVNMFIEVRKPQHA
jgi:extracellular factor (EF) 3-hydroxypalmitic acid methyl ester biosynthesis protein